MAKIMDNGTIRDMTEAEQAQYDADMSAPMPEEPVTTDEILAALEAALNG